MATRKDFIAAGELAFDALVVDLDFPVDRSTGFRVEAFLVDVALAAAGFFRGADFLLDFVTLADKRLLADFLVVAMKFL